MDIQHISRFAGLNSALLSSMVGCASVTSDRAVSIGNPAQDLSATTQLSIPYQEAYIRALRFGHDCHDIARNHQWNAEVHGSVNKDASTAIVHVKRAALQGGGDFEQLSFAATRNGTAMVIVVNNTRWWGQSELEAAESSVKTGIPSCHWLFDNNAS